MGDRLWLGFCVSVSVFLLFPALGALGLVIVLVVVWRRHHRQLVRHSWDWVWISLSGLLIVGSILAEYPQAAWLGLANFLPYFLLFFALKWLIRQSVQLRQLAWILILPSLPIMVLGLGQMYLAWDTVALTQSILGWGLIPGGVPPQRMSSVFSYANLLAIYLAISLALTLGLGLEHRRQPTLNVIQQFCLALIVLLDIIGIVLTSSRNAWGLSIFIVTAYALYLGWNWLVWSIVGGAIAVFWAAFVPSLGGTQLRYVVPDFVWLRLADSAYDRPIETLRITHWQFCWDLIQQRPWFGWGLRNFSPLYELKTGYWFGHPHNLWLMFAAETGIVTSVLLLASVGRVMFRACQLLLARREIASSPIFFSYIVAFTSYIIFNLADVSIFDLRINTIAWVLLAAIDGVVAARASQNYKSKINRSILG